MATASPGAARPVPLGPAGSNALAALVVVALVLALALVPRFRALPRGAPPAAEGRGRTEPVRAPGALEGAAASPAEPLPWVAPAEARVLREPAWTDPRWLERIALVLGGLEPCEIEVAEWLDPLRDALSALSFVERVERCELDPEAGLLLDLVLRRPVACIPVGDEFALVDENGVVLEGRWPMPPRLGQSTLPVIGRLGDPLLARARPGDWLVEPEHLDALDVALSMAGWLGESERASLGRVVIDARAARRASVTEPGIRLELEGGRQAWFGRAPRANEPGELPVAEKWRALLRARELFAANPAGADWDVVDLRWDRPDLVLRQAPALAALSGTPRRSEPARSSSRSRAARADEDGDGRPRVR